MFSAQMPVRGVPGLAPHHPSLLADRLKKLVPFGVLRRVPYQESRKRHECILTVLQHRFGGGTNQTLENWPLFKALLCR
jgi:DNA-binding HxlR family transcriptional regulator